MIKSLLLQENITITKLYTANDLKIYKAKLDKEN